MTRLRDLPGLGEKTEKWLNDVGIRSVEHLAAAGPVQAYIRVLEAGGQKPSLLLLYALVGALDGRHWQQVAREDRGRLLTELAGYQEHKAELERCHDPGGSEHGL